MNYAEAAEKLQKYGQEHVLAYYDELSDEDKEKLLEQIADTDFSVIKEAQNQAPRGIIKPIDVMALPEIEAGHEHFREEGLRAIKAGKVGALLLAGGMGTRLGSDDPKGMYNIGLTRDVYIFERLISNLLDVVNESGTYIQLFVMTSEKNHDANVNFFKEQNYFGYDSAYVAFFRQDMAPATDYEGKVYM